MKLCGFDVGIDRPLFVIAGRARSWRSEARDRGSAKQACNSEGRDR